MPVEQQEYSKGFGRNGSWMQTYSGRQFWPIDPRPEDIDIVDIAHALSMQCRYAGHSNVFYSVAEHCVLVSAHASRLNKLAALLHDASEAYLSDITRPVKPYLENYVELEQRIERCIAERFGVAYPWPYEVKFLDNSILADEQRALMPNPPADWGLQHPPLNVTFRYWTPAEAKTNYLKTFLALTDEKGGC